LDVTPSPTTEKALAGGSRKKWAFGIAAAFVVVGLGYWYGMPNGGTAGGMDSAGNTEGKEEAVAKEPEFLKQGLVAYYPFNGNANDESGNGLDGEVTKAFLAADRHGNPDSAYETKKDGGHILLPNDPVFNLQKHTICGWFRLLEMSTHPCLITKLMHNVNQPYGLWGEGRAYSLWATNRQEISLKNTLTADFKQWIFLAGTFDGKEMAAYINGELSDSRSEQMELRHFPGERVSIGTRYGVESDRFQSSRVDDVRIYNRALSAQEVKALYDSEKTSGK
jgi:hypothetical protein